VDATRRPSDRRPSDDTPQVVVRKGGRVRAALRCPYCHDQVGRRDMLACARGRYHRECWEECARWDGCAALACGSREAREVSALGYVVRLLRLALAALLFPPRVARALITTEGAGVVSIFRQALTVAWVIVPSSDASKNGPGKFMLHLLSAVPAVYLVWAILEHTSQGGPAELVLLIPVVFIGLMIFAPFLLALVATISFYGLRGLALAFRGELAAFGRQDAPIRSVRSALKKESDPANG
jgi:hypothetical protein